MTGKSKGAPSGSALEPSAGNGRKVDQLPCGEALAPEAVADAAAFGFTALVACAFVEAAAADDFLTVVAAFDVVALVVAAFLAVAALAAAAEVAFAF